MKVIIIIVFVLWIVSLLYKINSGREKEVINSACEKIEKRLKGIRYWGDTSLDTFLGCFIVIFILLFFRVFSFVEMIVLIIILLVSYIFYTNNKGKENTIKKLIFYNISDFGTRGIYLYSILKMIYVALLQIK